MKANDLLNFKHLLAHWGTEKFSDELKAQIGQLTSNTLPLQQGLSHTDYASDDVTEVVIINTEEKNKTIQAKVGLFYHGMNSGSCCADDPTPVELQTEYCVVLVSIEQSSGETTISLVDENETH